MASDPGTERAKDRLRRVGDALDVYAWVQERPWVSVLLAVGIGGLAARMPRSKLLTFLDLLLQLLPDQGSVRERE